MTKKHKAPKGLVYIAWDLMNEDGTINADSFVPSGAVGFSVNPKDLNNTKSIKFTGKASGTWELKPSPMNWYLWRVFFAEMVGQPLTHLDKMMLLYDANRRNGAS